MRPLVAFCLVLFATGPVGAIPFEDARHLAARTGFGLATADEIAALGPLDYESAVDRLLDGVRRDAVTAPPEWVDEPGPDWRAIRTMDANARAAFFKSLRERRLPLKMWWFGEILRTDSPLTERMVLFWHNHFTSSLNKVRWPHLLYHQNALFRRLATGNFAELLRAVARDRAMLLYLDSQTNRVGQANENFARELLELFTLGEGQGYTERDIREAARAFTGWMVNPGTGEFTVARRFHDTGSKTFLGRTGRFDGDDIIDIVLDQPRIAEHICEKLWRAFVSDTPDAGAVRRLAAVFRGSGYELRPTLRALFLSAEFRAPANRGVLTKSPVDVVAGTLRFMDALDMDRKKGVRVLRAMGQDLFDPPNVKGWPGGSAWITTETLSLRYQFLGRLSRGVEMAMTNGAGAPAMAMMSAPADRVQARLRGLLLAVEPLDPPGPSAAPMTALRRLLTDPAYQAK